MNIEAVRKREILAFGQNGSNALLVNIRHLLVGRKHHDDIRFFCSFTHRIYFKSRLFRNGPGPSALVESDNDFNSAIFQVERMRMPLTSEADHGNGLILETLEIAICLMKNARFLRFGIVDLMCHISILR